MPLAPASGGVTASHLLFSTSSPSNRSPASPAHRTPSSTAHHTPSSPAHRTPSSPAHRAPASPAHRSLASLVNRIPASPTHYSAPYAQTVQPSDQAAIHSQFFIVLVGYSPGVYTSM